MLFNNDLYQNAILILRPVDAVFGGEVDTYTSELYPTQNLSPDSALAVQEACYCFFVVEGCRISCPETLNPEPKLCFAVLN